MSEIYRAHLHSLHRFSHCVSWGVASMGGGYSHRGVVGGGYPNVVMIASILVRAVSMNKVKEVSYSLVR